MRIIVIVGSVIPRQQVLILLIERESVVWDKLLDQAGSLGIFLVIFSSMMCGASRDLPEGVGIMDHEWVQSTRLPVLDCTCLR